MSSVGKSFRAKGKSGQHKRYFKGKYARSSKKSKQTPDFSVGDYVVFRTGSNVLVGIVASTLENGKLKVKSSERTDCKNIQEISSANDPRPISSLQVPLSDVTPLLEILTVWTYSGEFLSLTPANILKFSDNSLWVKPNEHICPHAVWANLKDICLNPYKDLQGPAKWTDRVDPGDICYVSSVLKLTQSELDSILSSYSDALNRLQSVQVEKDVLTQQLATVTHYYNDAIGVIQGLQDGLMNVQSEKRKRIKTIFQIISEQKSGLDRSERELLAKNKELLALRKDFQENKAKLEEANRQCQFFKQKVKTLQLKNEDLTSQVKMLTEEIDLSRRKHDATTSKLLEIRPNTSTSSSDVLMTRPAGSQKRASAFVPVVLPEVPASQASLKSLECRARQLGKMLDIISSQEENASDEDIIAVLATYLRRNYRIAQQAIVATQLEINVTELSPAEAVDLKVLLSLPMNKVRNLRTFLKNANRDIIPSEKAIYSEIQRRRTAFGGNKTKLEVGTARLKKTNASEPSEIAFVRIRSLRDHIEDVISRSLASCSLKEDSFMQGMLWLKIGGDKGGSSTKLAMQIANDPECNSAHKTHLLGMFEAYDSTENLRNIFGPFTEDFIQLQEADHRIELDGTCYPVNVFLFGDYEFLCKVLGHMGASATYPCLWCHVRLSDLTYSNGPHSPMLWDDDEAAFRPNPSWPSARTAESFQVDLAANRADPRRGGDMRANGANHHSICEDPILPIMTDTLNIVPPSLHIMLGLVVRYFKVLESYCRSYDHDSLGERDAELNEEWENASVRTKHADAEYMKAKSQVREEEEVLEDFKRARHMERPANLKCTMPLCAISGREAMGDVDWLQCTRCGVDRDSGWFHVTCLRLSMESDFSVCPLCKGEISSEQDVLKFQREQIKEAKSEVARLKIIHDNCKSALDEVFSRVLATRGPCESELNSILETELKVQRQAYHSQCFVGNHCRIILQQHATLLRVIKDSALRAKLGELFSRLDKIFSLFAARFLSDEEVTEICNLCWSFGEWFPVAFPDEKIPPKLHFLIAHIPQCAKKWHTIGLLSEQGLESIHACVNSEERVYACVRERKEKLFHIFNQHSQKSIADRSKLEVVRRKCTEGGCGGRFKVIEGVRRCPKCGALG